MCERFTPKQRVGATAMASLKDKVPFKLIFVVLLHPKQDNELKKRCGISLFMQARSVLLDKYELSNIRWSGTYTEIKDIWEQSL